MKLRFKKQYVAGGLFLAAMLWPIGYIELGCRPGAQPANTYKPILSNKKDQRPEARTLLTYPEWHIVYSADSLANHLKTKPPSGYRYMRDVSSFWSSYCALNRVANPKDAGDAKIMLYTIGLSFSAEMLVKATYENTIGRIFEWIGGWHSASDRYAADVQSRYGTFMHETPWYQFPFSPALNGLWGVKDGGVRHWERRFALSMEYGVKTGYAKLIGWASGTTLGADETRMRMVLEVAPEQVVAIDPRVKILSSSGTTYIVETPRYAQFTDIAKKLAKERIAFREIAGNDEIFFTMISPTTEKGSKPLMVMPLGDRPGWERRGYMVKVPDLSETLIRTPPSGATVEHIYDY